MKKKHLKALLIIIGIAVALAILTAITWPYPKIWFGDIFGVIRGIVTNVNGWHTFGIVFCIFAVAIVFIVWLLPILIYFFKKLFIYLSLATTCLFKGYKFKTVRAPFSALKGLDEKCDISIKTDEGTLNLHFLDVIFPTRRTLTVSNNEEYVITPVTVGKMSKQGAGAAAGSGTGANVSGQIVGLFRVTEHTVFKNKDKVKTLPQVSFENGEKHILLIPTMPVGSKIIKGKEQFPFASGLSVGGFTFLSFKQLKKGLKKQLHISLFD